MNETIVVMVRAEEGLSFADLLHLDARSLSVTGRRRAYGVGIGLVLLAAAAAYLFVDHFGPHHKQYDLKIYYHAVQYWLSGHNLYDYSQPDPVNVTLGYTYPPVAAVLMSPMLAFSIPTTVAITVAAIAAATGACVWLILRQTLALPALQLSVVAGVVTAVTFVSQPIRQTVAFGQINVFLVLLVLLDVLVLGRRGSRWTGVGVGLAMAIKLTPGIFLLYFLVARQWRAAAVSCVTAALASALSALVAPKETLQFFAQLMWQSDRVGFVDNTTNQSINGLLARLSSPDAPSKVIWLICSAFVIWLGAHRIHRAVAAGDTVAALTLTGIVGLLVSPVSWIHHAVWVVPAYVMLTVRFTRMWHESRPALLGKIGSAAQNRTRRELVALTTLFVTGAFVWVLDTRVFFGLPDTDYSHLGLGSVVAASVQTFWLIAAMTLLPVNRPAGVRPVVRRDPLSVLAEADGSM